MNGKGWRLSFSVIVLILVVALAMKWLEPPVSTSKAENEADIPALATAASDLRVYLPPLHGMIYYFTGKGMEYAAFSRRITSAAPGFLQIEDTSGTNLAQVAEYNTDELKVIWSETEFYENRSLLDPSVREGRKGGEPTNLVFLKAPVIKGQKWNDASFQREIVSTDHVVTVPLGTFYEVVVVKSRSLQAEDFVQYEYYAKNMGLIKREALYVQDGETFAVVSSLNSLACPPPQF